MNTDKKLYRLGLENIGATDGREILFTKGLRKYLSEGALHRYRAMVEIELLIAFSESNLKGFPSVLKKEKQTMRALVKTGKFHPFAVAQYDHFKRKGIGPLEHDVKAGEMYLRELFGQNNLEKFKEFIHFPATSEDISNLAWNCLLRDAINKEWLPNTILLCDELTLFAKNHATDPIVGRTHGMPASPTTFGKRFAYFLSRYTNVLNTMSKLRLSGKFSGPVGNHNAMTIVAPEFDMAGFAKKFVESFGFYYEPMENQRNSHMEIVRLLEEINHVNILSVDLCHHLWLSVMMGYLVQKADPRHTGSSVMPHKTNPWSVEAGKAYFNISSVLIQGAIPGLVQSFFERDLSDHPWERTYGDIVGKSLTGIKYIILCLKNLTVNTERALKELNNCPEIITEAIQIAGRLGGVDNIYMAIKEASRDKSPTLSELHGIIDKYIKNEEMKAQLKSISPKDYIGIADKLAYTSCQQYETLRECFKNGFLNVLSGVSDVIFDLDGTLHLGDKNELYAKLTAVSKALGSGFSKDEIESFGDHSDYLVITSRMVTEHNKRYPQRQVTTEMFADETKKVSGTFDHLFYLAPGALRLLSLLKQQGYRLSLVSTRGPNSLPRILENYGITNYFTVIINGGDTKVKKPHPEPIIRALEKLGISGNQAVYIGDKQLDDVTPACALDMKSILVSKEPLDKYGAVPTLHVSSIAEIVKYFN